LSRIPRTNRKDFVKKVISSVAEQRHLPSPLDVMLECYFRSLVEIVDLVPSDLPYAVVAQHPVSANQHILDPVRQFFPVAVQRVEELANSRSTMGINHGNMLRVLFFLGAILSAPCVRIYPSLNPCEEPVDTVA